MMQGPSWVKSVALAVGRLLPVVPWKRTLSGPVTMSQKCRFCCKSRLRRAANRDSVVLTRFSVRSIHDGPSEE